MGALADKAVSASQAAEEGLLPDRSTKPVVDGIDVDAVLTPETIANYRERFRRIEADIAEIDVDPTLQHYLPDLEREREALINQLSAGTSKGGQPRIRSAAKSACDAIRRAVEAAKRTLAETEPELVAHFDKVLTTRTQCSYEPDDPVPWVLSRITGRRSE